MKTKMTPDEIIDAVQAFKQGRTIECNSVSNPVSSNRGWIPTSTKPQDWNFALLRYRARPLPPEPPREWVIDMRRPIEGRSKGARAAFPREQQPGSGLFINEDWVLVRETRGTTHRPPPLKELPLPPGLTGD